MTAIERRATFGLALVLILRILGLFMLLPVFAIYAPTLAGATPTLVGMALGVYGLTQGIFQIPVGLLSDRIGRRPAITLGLVIFILGSLVASLSHHIYGVILGRLLQGAGVIGSAVLAFVADFTSESNRTKAMATVGMLMGVGFASAMVLGPVLKGWFGVSGIFGVSALLGLCGLLILYLVVPAAPEPSFHGDAETDTRLLKDVIRDADLMTLNWGIFTLHSVLTAAFVVVPVILTDILNQPVANQWRIYLPILFLAFVTAIPAIIFSEKKQRVWPTMLVAIVILGFSNLWLWWSHRELTPMTIGLYFLLSSFTLLEALLPSLVSKTAPAGSKGTAIGVFSSSQFLGIFVGGGLGGWLYGHHHVFGVLLLAFALTMSWLLVAMRRQSMRR